MQISIEGFLVCAAILLIARWSEEPFVVALIASLAFGATAIATVYSLGGSSPLIYAMFAAALLVSVALRRDVFRGLGTVLSQQPAAWFLIVLVLYTVVGSFLLPRIFAGETTVFIPQRSVDGAGGIVEVPLAPSSGNITQTLYFVLGILSFFAVSILLLQRKAFIAIRQGYFTWAILHISMGYIDLLGKIAGLGDVLAPIRTASFAMLTDVDVAGFWRIAGAYSEASAFGAATVLLLAFTFTYWKITRDATAMVLSLALLVLLVLSTSSTAYVAGGLLGIWLFASLTAAVLRNRLQKQDLILIVAGVLGVVVFIGIVVYNDNVLEPFRKLFDAMIFDKASSASGQERAYWNMRSLQSVADTVGLGIGLGSSRASSWVVGVVSQLGIVGSLILAYVILEVVRSGRLHRSNNGDFEVCAVILSVRSAVLAGLVTKSVSGASADPSLAFFVGTAVALNYRRFLGPGGRPATSLTGGRLQSELDPGYITREALPSPSHWRGSGAS